MNGTKHPTACAAAGAVCRAAVLCAGSVVLSAAVAAEYSWQVTGGYEDIDSEGNIETNRSSMRATRYLSAVDDQVGPWELAPFLNRSSHVAVSTGRTKLRERSFPAIFGNVFVGDGRLPDIAPVRPSDIVSPVLAAWPTESGTDSSEYAVDGRYVWPGSGWYAGARVSRSDAGMLPEHPFAQTTADHESAGIFAGRYFGARTALELDFGPDTASQEVLVAPFVFGPVFGAPVFGDPVLPGIPGFEPIELRTGTEIETDDARLSIRHVGQLGDSTVAFSASIRTSRSETRLILPRPRGIFPAIDEFGSPEGSFYYNPFMAAGLDSIASDLFESERERGYSLSGALFPTPALGVRLTYTNSDHDTYGISDVVGLSANWFFLRNAAIEIQLVRTDSGGRYFTGSPDSDSLGVRLLGRF